MVQYETPSQSQVAAGQACRAGLLDLLLNQLHTHLQQLRKVEEKYHDVLAVIGIHPAELPAKRSEAGLRDSVGRYVMQHPVVNDPQFQIWIAYAVHA